MSERLHLQEVTSVVGCFTLPQCHICIMRKYRENTGSFFNMAELTKTRWNLAPTQGLTYVHNIEFGKTLASVHVKILTFVPLKCNEVNVLNLSCPAVSLNCGKNTK